jgi:hypothetical protein
LNSKLAADQEYAVAQNDYRFCMQNNDPGQALLSKALTMEAEDYKSVTSFKRSNVQFHDGICLHDGEGLSVAFTRPCFIPNYSDCEMVSFVRCIEECNRTE